MNVDLTNGILHNVVQAHQDHASDPEGDNVATVINALVG